MKDAKGHGSNSGRGKVKVSVTRPIGHTIHAVGPGGKKTLIESYTPNASGAHNGVLLSNAAAARDLASGPKSGAAPVHDSMRSPGQSDQSYITQRLTANADKTVGMERNPGESNGSYIQRRVT